MGSIETAVRYSRKFEAILENRYGASGKGLHEKISSIEERLPKDTTRLLRKIATIRNRAVHEDGYEINNLEDFIQTCDYVLLQLESANTNRRRTTNQTYSYPVLPYIIFFIMIAIIFHFYGDKILGN